MIHNMAAVPKYDFDLVVIGGGSGGLAAAKVCSEVNFIYIYIFLKFKITPCLGVFFQFINCNKK